MKLTIINKNNFLTEIEFPDSDLEAQIKKENCIPGQGYSWELYSTSILHSRNFLSTSAIMADFNDGITIEGVRAILTRRNFKGYIITSKNNRVVNLYGTSSERFHLILPLRNPIEDREQYEYICKNVHELFSNKTNPYMHTLGRYLSFSPMGAYYEAINLSDTTSNYIDDIVLISEELEAQEIFCSERNIKYSKKITRSGVIYSAYCVRNLENRTFYDSTSSVGDVIRVTPLPGEEQAIICPFHNHYPVHDAFCSLRNNRVEIRCPDFNQVFFPMSENDNPDPEEPFLPFEGPDLFEKNGYIVGRLTDKQILYFIFNTQTTELRVFYEDAMKKEINSLYKRLAPTYTKSGWAYFCFIDRDRRSFSIIDRPKQRGANYSSLDTFELNLFTHYPLRNFNPAFLQSIYTQVCTDGWDKTLHNRCPSISLLLQNLMGLDFEIDGLKFFLNWLCGVFVYLEKPTTAIIFNGNADAGLDILFQYILTPMFGQKRLSKVLSSDALSDYNDFLVGKSIICVHEPAYYKKDSYELISKLIYWVKHSSIRINRKQQVSFDLDIPAGLIWQISQKLPEEFYQNDKVFSIFKTRTSLSNLRDYSGAVIDSQNFISNIQRELQAFTAILLSWDFDMGMFSTVHHSEHRKNLLNLAAGNLEGLLLELASNQNINDLIPRGYNRANELALDLAETFKIPQQGFIPTSVLTELYNAHCKDIITPAKLSTRTRDLIGKKAVDHRFGKDNKVYKGFMIADIRNGMRNLQGNTDEIISYKPITSKLYSQPKSDEPACSSRPGLYQDSKTKQLLFNDRPVYFLEIDPVTVQLPTGNMLVDIYVIANHREENLFLNSEYEDLRPYIKISNDDEDDLLPATAPIPRTTLNQFFTYSEASLVIDYLSTQFRFTANAIPPSCVLFPSEADIQARLTPKPATVYELPYETIPDFDLTVYVVSADGTQPDICLPDLESLIPYKTHLYKECIYR